MLLLEKQEGLKTLQPVQCLIKLKIRCAFFIPDLTIDKLIEIAVKDWGSGGYPMTSLDKEITKMISMLKSSDFMNLHEPITRSVVKGLK